MSSEIVAAVDGSTESSVYAGEDIIVLDHRQVEGLGVTADIGGFDLRDFSALRAVGNPSVNVDLIGGNHHIRHFLSPEMGHKYVSQLNPTQASLKDTLKEMKEPSVLLLRGCDALLLPVIDFPFDKFKTLTVLEISGVTHLTTLPEKEISEMVQLQNLTLSHLPIQRLPSGLFFDHLKNLRSLVLRGCSNLHSLPDFPKLPAIQSLDLSYLLIQTLPQRIFDNLINLRWLILRGCSKLRSLPITETFSKLEVLDLYHCTAFNDFGLKTFTHTHLKMLDLSCTALYNVPMIVSPHDTLTHLFLRGLRWASLKYFHLQTLEVLDLSGVKTIKKLHLLKGSDRLVALDLSRTTTQTIDFISEVVHLRYLILRECTMLVQLPAMGKLTELEVLDISGCDKLKDLPEDLSSLKNIKELNLSGCSCLKEPRESFFDQMSCIEKIDLSKTNIKNIPSISNLINPPTLSRSHVSVEESSSCRPQGRISKPNEVHLVSTFFSSSGFDRFKQGFGKLVGLISNIQENCKLILDNTTNSSPTNVGNAMNVGSCVISSQIFMRNSTGMLMDLEYILANIDLLESSLNRMSAEELLVDLMNASTHLSALDFGHDSTNLIQLLRLVAKLKLLFTPKKEDALEKNNQKKKERFTVRSNENDVSSDTNDGLNWRLRQHLSRSYDSLTDIQRNCLLYFSAFPKGGLKIKGRVLIQLWHGEGFIDPMHEENVSLSNANSTENPQSTTNQNLNLDPTTYSNTNPEIMGTGIETSAARNDANQVSTSNGVENLNTIEEIGGNILMVLEEKKFIEIKRSDSLDVEDDLSIWHMNSSVHSFVRERAKEQYCFFNFDQNNGNLTPLLLGSQRACLLKSQDNFPSSSKLWMNYTNSTEKLKSFKTIRTLLNVDEPVVDIRAEWFSKMRNLSVINLGRWEYGSREHIEVVDLKFLEELKNMKQLRLLSLEGFSAFTKLPNSVCKLTNLKMLNLRDCSYLEELPVGIGSLNNLTHLDITDCHILYKLPKGLRFLSKLEVLKGFVIYYQIGGQQSRNACTLEDLSLLGSLRILKLVVNRDRFPDNEDLHVFKKMTNLYNLKITWEKNYDKDQESHGVAGQKALSWHSRFQRLNCCQVQTHQRDTEEPLRSNHLVNLNKLKLCCFPLETAPNWLDSSQLRKLEKLSILGGKLKTLLRDTIEIHWNVKTLNLRYLHDMDMDWYVLRRHFPNMTRFTQGHCKFLSCHPKWTTEMQNAWENG